MAEITLDLLEGIVDNLPEEIPVKFWGRDIKAWLVEYGIQINGFFIVFGTTSPEGYDTKFVVFDDEIVKLFKPKED